MLIWPKWNVPFCVNFWRMNGEYDTLVKTFVKSSTRWPVLADSEVVGHCVAPPEPISRHNNSFLNLKLQCFSLLCTSPTPLSALQQQLEFLLINYFTGHLWHLLLVLITWTHLDWSIERLVSSFTKSVQSRLVLELMSLVDLHRGVSLPWRPHSAASRHRPETCQTFWHLLFWDSPLVR